MRIYPFLRRSLRTLSGFGLFAAILLSGCQAPEASPAPNKDDASQGNDASEEQQPEEQALTVVNGDKTDILSARAATAPFDKTYLVPDGFEVVETANMLTFVSDQDPSFQVSVSTEPLPSDKDWTLRHDYTTLALRSNESEPVEIDTHWFPELGFDYYLTVDDSHGIVHRLVRFDEKRDHMYVAALSLPADLSEQDGEAYEEAVSLFHAILVSANHESDKGESSIDEDLATVPLTQKLSGKPSAEANTPEESPVTEVPFFYDGEDHSVLAHTFVLFDTLEIQLPKGYQMRRLGEQSYSFWNEQNEIFAPISIIIGLAHPDVPADMHINALRSARTEIKWPLTDALDWYDYAFADANSEDEFSSITLIKELADGRILDLSVHTSEQAIDSLVLEQLLACLATATEKQTVK
ncbi:hypothetical protein SFC23_08565 [Shouchella clausii]|uniref:hypothetical protein n=1 Tax=Shouchella clausii TaxID=79880 RepID=UPI00203D0793|nr:hypothetical protein [Shouchella clausii]MCM3548089.1 hypothetical protein [Shouchella clausii]